MPIFQTAEIEQQRRFQIQSFDTTAKPLFLAMEEQAEVALQVNDLGTAIFL